MTTHAHAEKPGSTAARIGLPLPNGWYAVAFSEELGPAGVVKLRACGADLVAWRGHDGVARVADAFCPHLGAHLGVGGVVVGDTLQCPFHGWRFGGDGHCVDAPYAKNTPKCGLSMWRTLERNGFVWVWFHAKNAAPDVDVPLLKEHGDPGWTAPVKRTWTVRSHIQEMGENSVDRAHFRYVHGTLEVPEVEVHVEDDGRLFHVVNRAKNKAFGRVVDTLIDIRLFGPGISIIRFAQFAEVVLFASTTPVDDESVVQRFSFTAKKAGNPLLRRFVARAFMREVARQYEQDTPIWEHKVHLEKPILCDGDGPIWAYRKWFQRFYAPPPSSALRTVP